MTRRKVTVKNKVETANGKKFQPEKGKEKWLKVATGKINFFNFGLRYFRPNINAKIFL